MLQQNPGVPGVLAGDKIDIFQISKARRVISPRFPIGVATTVSIAVNLNKAKTLRETKIIQKEYYENTHLDVWRWRRLH